MATEKIIVGVPSKRTMTTTITFTYETWRRLKEEATRRGLDLKDIVQEACDKYLAKMERED